MEILIGLPQARSLPGVIQQPVELASSTERQVPKGGAPQFIIPVGFPLAMLAV
jgi:hypothetical protein